MILLYKYICFLLIPLIKINIYYRVLKGKESKERFYERYGISKINKPKKDLIWIHATSVGEFNSANTIIEKFYLKNTILLTTTTLAASDLALRKYGNRIIHQFLPLDVSIWVERFINHWQPKLVIWIESDLWPNTLSLLKKKSIKSILLNVRISPKSFNKWNIYKKIYKEMTDCFSEIYAQSELDQERVEILTNRKIKFIGNLKLSSSFKEKNPKNKNNLIKDYKEKIFMLASTHDNEEEIFIPLIKKLLSKYNGLRIIIAPRHPDRSLSIKEKYIKEKISTNIIDSTKKLDYKVSIINSFGDLPYYYNLSDVVFLGGSFVKKGGHNPIEPAANNCAIITGPYVFNWQNIYNKLLEKEACYLFQEMISLERIIMQLFSNDELMKTRKQKASDVSKISFFDSEKIFFTINKYLREENC